jgi:hypothetical protein
MINSEKQMKKPLLILLMALLLFPAMLFAQATGKVMDNLSMKSKILKSNRKYAIYLPPDYDASQRSYPNCTCCTAPATTRRGGYSSGRCSG